MKTCDKCGQTNVPDEYNNLLCDACYIAIEAEKQKAEEEAKKPKVIPTLENTKNGIADPNYVENPEAEDKEQWATNIHMFERNGVMLWPPTRGMYTFIKNQCLERTRQHPQFPKFVWRPKIVDIGCGSGVGSNVLSQEADFVWGIDKNERSIRFAKECFERIKNGIYYSSEIKFDIFDVVGETRETMKFDVVTLIEVIEHVGDYKNFISSIIKRFDNGKRNESGTVYYISTPNRNNKHIGQGKPINPFHVREWTSQEFAVVLSEFFSSIKFYNTAGVPTEYDTTHTPLLAECKI